MTVSALSNSQKAYLAGFAAVALAEIVIGTLHFSIPGFFGQHEMIGTWCLGAGAGVLLGASLGMIYHYRKESQDGLATWSKDLVGAVATVAVAITLLLFGSDLQTSTFFLDTYVPLAAAGCVTFGVYYDLVRNRLKSNNEIKYEDL